MATKLDFSGQWYGSAARAGRLNNFMLDIFWFVIISDVVHFPFLASVACLVQCRLHRRVVRILILVVRSQDFNLKGTPCVKHLF